MRRVAALMVIACGLAGSACSGTESLDERSQPPLIERSVASWWSDTQTTDSETTDTTSNHSGSVGPDAGSAGDADTTDAPIDATTVRPDVYELGYTDVTGADRTVVVEVRSPDVGPATTPVVVWSHGGSVGKSSPAKVGEQWGRAMNQAGFTFVAIAHPGRDQASRNALCEAIAVVECAEFKYLLWDRLNDASLVFDWLEQMATNGDLFVDVDRLVYGGHSAGAVAVMLMAGMESPYANRDRDADRLAAGGVSRRVATGCRRERVEPSIA